MAVTLPMEWEDRRYPKLETAHRSAYNPTPTLDGPARSLGGGGDDVAACLRGLDAGVVTRVTNLAQGGDAQGFRVRNPPLRAVTEAVPNTFAPIVDRSRQSEAFGRRLLPHLRRILLHSKVPTAVLRALASMGDLAHDPERVSQAAREWAATSLVQLLRSDNHLVREHSCNVLLTLSGHPVGRDALLQEPHAVPALQLLMFDEKPSVRLAAAHTLRRLARLAHGPHDLDEGALAPFLVHLLRWETCPDTLAVHLITLQYLLYKDHTKLICIQQGAFMPLTSFLINSTSPEVVCHALNVMSLLSTCYERGLEEQNLPLVVGTRLRSLLDAPQQELRAAAARFVMSFTYSEHAKTCAAGLAEPLLRLALRRRGNRGAQVFALQALTQLAEAPAVRELLLAAEEDIEEAEVSDDATEALRQRLLAVVRATP